METDIDQKLKDLERPKGGAKILASNALELLQAVYRDPDQDLYTRIRAARDCLPFETPKLAVVASVNAPEGLAERLERALAAAQQVQAERAGRLIEGRCTEVRPKALPPAGSDSREGNAR